MSSSTENSGWSTKAILTVGSLGDEASRRYTNRSMWALLAMVVALGATAKLGSAGKLLNMAIPGAAFAYIAWQFRNYLAVADELAKRIHLEAMGWTYLIGIAAGIGLGALAKGEGWNINPGFIILLEPVRAGALYLVARRYR